MCDIKLDIDKIGDDFTVYDDINIDLPTDICQCIERHGSKPESLIVVLHAVQKHYGYIPAKIGAKVAQVLNVSLAKVYGVITFYHLFKLKKPGKYKIQVCMGTACYLKGAKDLISGLESILSIGVNGITKNGLFSLETVRCVGCCGLAPVIVVGEDVYGNLKKEDLPNIISKYTKT